MAEAISVSSPISGTDQTLTFETGKLAPQSQGAVVDAWTRRLPDERNLRPTTGVSPGPRPERPFGRGALGG